LPRFSKYQVSILISSSCIFYAYYKPILLLLLLCSAGINVLASYYVVYGKKSRQKLLAIVGVICNISLLAFFKYSPLISKTLLDTQGSIGEFLLTIPLPIGISFFTFEGISLLIDVFYKNDIDKKSLISDSFIDHGQRVLLFISFFPHLIAGPILKAHDFLPQINHKLFIDIEWEKCFKYLVIGYFFKMVIADNLKDFTVWIDYPHFQIHTSVTLVTMLLGYSCQIFADFAGYSLIAIGLGRLFGYELMNNFNFPYVSTSFKEFWKRWHISLSTFLMKYLYFPLGGNRKGNIRTHFNLIITMFLGGLWHGAGWNYAVWGTFHGLALVVERLLWDKMRTKSGVIAVVLKRIIVFSFVTLAWLLFKLADLSYVIMYINTILTNWSLSYSSTICLPILMYSMPVFLYHILYLLKDKNAFNFVKKYEYISYGIMMLLIFTNSGSSGAFIYFQF
jgi:alginate O-acetyltransferase complex protein AlgI